jgi:periplasmic protein TonB
MRLFGSILIVLIFIVGILYPNAIFAQQQNKYLPFAEVMPQPKGGLAAIYKHITYPEIARESGVQGKEYLLIYVDEKGNVNDVKVIKGLGAGCDQAAIDGVKSVKFTPGENNGKPVKVKLSLAITFKLQ